MKSPVTDREYPVHSHLPTEPINHAYERGVDGIMSALADDFGLKTNGYGGREGRKALVEHVREKLGMEIDLPIPVGDQRARLIEALKPSFVVLAGDRNTDTHTHLVLEGYGNVHRKKPVMVQHHNLDEMQKLIDLQRKRIETLEDRIDKMAEHGGAS